MYKIGEFSNITGVSVKTLRYYDQIDLLKPSEINLYTNYRYYTDEELELYRTIEYLKKLGFTLEEIKKCIKDISIEDVLNKKDELILKRDYIDSQIEELDVLLKKIRLKAKILKKH